MKKISSSDKIFDFANTGFLLLISIIILYPLIYVLSASISDPNAVSSGSMWLWPIDITFEGYTRVFEDERILIGYRNTILYTVLGTLLHLMIILPCAYALSRKVLIGKKAILWLILFTMLFNGGLIPTYLVVKSLGMVNTIWAIIVVGAADAWSILVARAFFQQNIPDALVESAEIDGASTFRIFIKIVLPLSAPIIAVMALFKGVGIWNQYFNALIYLSDESLYPLQLVLRSILILNQMSEDMLMTEAGQMETLAEQSQTAQIIKYAVIIIAAGPMLIVYPFIQRFFVKGVLVGSIKE